MIIKYIIYQVVSDQFKILDETKSFYENLYKKRKITESDLEVLITKLKKIEFPKLSDTESKSIEGPSTKSEILSLKKEKENDKTPGPEGFTCEFFLDRYKLFYYKSNQ